MPKIDFSAVVGEKNKKPDKKKPRPVKKDTAKTEEKAQARKAGKGKPTTKKVEKTLEKEIMSFDAKTKKEREKASKGFDFKQVGQQIREKASAMPSAKKKEPLRKKVAAKIREKVLRNRSLERIATGIKGLDNLIEGGFEKGAAILIVGSAGTGKTIFGMQFLYHGAKDHNEPGIYISFEEEKEVLYKHTASFGWDFEELEKRNLFKVMEYKPHHVEKLMAEGGGTIKDEIRAMGAKRLVIDSITAYALLFKDEYQKRENILDFFDMLGKWGCTSIIISELPPKLAEIKEGSVGFLTDAIISLYYSKDTAKGIRVHSCEILKMRGTKHTNKLLALGFENEGIVIYPEVEVF